MSRFSRFARRSTRGIARSVLGSSPHGVIGHWDSPAETEIAVGKELLLSGWALSYGSQPPVVTVFRDGIPIGTAIADRHRPDLELTFGRSLVGGGWGFALSTSDVDEGGSLHLVARATDENGSDAKSLGSRALRARVSTSMDGRLECPIDGAEVLAGGALQVSGWALFDERPADIVELTFGDRAPIRIRRATPRLEIPAALATTHPTAIAAGFTDLVSVPPDWAGRTVAVRLRAIGPAGDVWSPPAVQVKVAPRPEPAETLDRATSIAATAPTAIEGSRRASAGPLRVCAFTHSLGLGGGELYLHELLLRMASDHQVQILVVSPLDGPLKEELRAAGIEVHITAHYLTDAAHYMGRTVELGMIAKAFGADAVIVNTLGAFPAVDGALEAGIPVLWAIHESFDLEMFSYLNWGHAGLHPDVRQRWIDSLERATTIFEADATRRMFAEVAPALQGRQVMYGIELAEIERYRATHDRDELRRGLNIAPEQRVLLCMGVFQERKSQLALVLAFAEIADRFPDALLVMVGSHASVYAISVEETVASLGLQDRVRILPILRDTRAWYHAADILVSSSDTESLPRSMLEAHAFGLPVLAADVFGMPELIQDGVNGWLFDACSGLSLVAALRRVLDLDDEELREMSSQCLRDSTEYDGAGYASEYVQLIHEARDSSRTLTVGDR